VARFVEQLPVKLAQMDSAVTRADMQELASLAHWLKGAGGSVGFDDLFEPAKALELAAKAHDQPAALQVLADLHGLDRRIQRAVAPARIEETAA
jgi:HPt (histidine-containing phosphotransfer) domain-containing protein